MHERTSFNPCSVSVAVKLVCLKLFHVSHCETFCVGRFDIANFNFTNLESITRCLFLLIPRHFCLGMPVSGFVTYYCVLLFLACFVYSECRNLWIGTHPFTIAHSNVFIWWCWIWGTQGRRQLELLILTACGKSSFFLKDLFLATSKKKFVRQHLFHQTAKLSHWAKKSNLLLFGFPKGIHRNITTWASTLIISDTREVKVSQKDYSLT